MRNILITGAANGLGKAFLEHYLQQDKKDENRIFALDVSWPATPINTAVAAANTKNVLSFHKTDITSESDLEKLVKTIREKTAGDDDGVSKLDLVIHSAGIRGLVTNSSSSSVPTITQPSDVANAETLEIMNTATLLRTFEVNAVGTFQLIRHLLPFLKQAQQQHQQKENNRSCSKVFIMGSRMGSILSNVAGGGYAYRASKAALNAMVKSLALDVPDVCFLVTHPGRVATALCHGVREDGAMDPDEVVPALVELIEGCTLADSGRFVDRFGKDIGW